MLTSTLTRVTLLYAAAIGVVSVLPPVIEALLPRPGLIRSLYPQSDFSGTPIESRTTELSLRFLDDSPAFPRQHFSARWRGYFYISKPQTLEFFAGGDDEVQLRVNGEVLLTRNAREGMGTRSRTLALGAGAHEIAVDYRQFGGNLRLNIQRTLAGQQPHPFLSTELFSERVGGRQLLLLDIARALRHIAVGARASLALLLVIAFVAHYFVWWRTVGAPRSASEYGARLWTVAGPALLAPALVFLLGPYTIFTSNVGEFALPFDQLAAPWLLRTTAINWAILFAIGCVVAALSARATQIYIAALFALGLALWGQGHLWNPDYGVLNGNDVEFSEHAWRTPYELSALAVVLVPAVLFSRQVSRIAPFASLVFLGVQLSAAAASGSSTAVQGRQWSEPPADIFRFSSGHNIIHVVLDEFQSDVFADILEQDRRTLDPMLSGFTYFSDHAAAFPTTSMSMPAMLTGEVYRNQLPAPEFVREVLQRSSIFDKASRAGYDIDALSIVPTPTFEQWFGREDQPYWKGSRFRIRRPFISQIDYREVTSRQLLELSLFRHVPHWFKAMSAVHPDTFYGPIWMDRGESPAQIRRFEASNSVAFFQQFNSLMGVGREAPVYKLLHVGVPHRPIVVDSECRFIGETAMSRASYTEQSRCAIKLVGELLARARSLGIYDSSLIIISSDHGTDLPPLGFAGQSDSLSLAAGPSTSRLSGIVSSAKAVMLIKPPQSTGPIRISDAPTAHVDLQATIADLVKLPGASVDDSMFRRDASQPRTRLYGMYDPRQRFPTEYFERLDVLSIDGRITDAAAWNTVRSIWRPDLTLHASRVDVGPRDAHRFLGPGWSFEGRERTGSGEVTFARMVTKRAVLFASLGAGAVELIFHASAPGGVAPTLRVSVDGHEVGQFGVSARAGYSAYPVRVPAVPFRPAISEITLQFAPDEGNLELRVDRFDVKGG